MADWDCIDGRIGILGCGVPEGSATLFINQLPGVSLQNIEALADGNEQQTFIDVFADISLRARKKFEVLAKAALNICYRITDKKVVACLICEKVELFDVALWYLYGSELMIEVTSSDSLNRWTTIDLDRAEKLKAEFFAEFQAALDDAIKAISPEDSECVAAKCIPCNGQVNFVTQTP